MSLPIEDCLAEIVSAVGRKRPVVLRAPPGAGKTTMVPPAIFRSGVIDPLDAKNRLVLLQPRRVAARAAASRIAKLMGCDVGDLVGYQVRDDRRLSKRTAILSMTVGVLLRKLQSDPLLEDTAIVVIDEFHERSIEMDLTLAMLRNLRQLREDLQLIVMSATLSPEPLLDFLSDSVPIESEGRTYPVEVNYLGSVDRFSHTKKLISVTKRALSETSGDVLVFLPGVAMIDRISSEMRRAGVGFGGIDVMGLHGRMTSRDQDQVLRPASKTRRVILATNVAETSVTIDGVTAVVDTGLVRRLVSDPRTGLSRLETISNSIASADQRAGRAGRTASGIAYRMWDQAQHRFRDPFDAPEIETADLAGAVLLLHVHGYRSPTDFEWFEKPPTASLESAESQLRMLGAIDDSGQLTDLGRRVAEMPLPPRLARWMIAAEQFGCVLHAAIAGVLLTEKDPFRGKAISLWHCVSSVIDGDDSLGVDMRTLKSVLASAKKISNGLARSNGAGMEPLPGRSSRPSRREGDSTSGARSSQPLPKVGESSADNARLEIDFRRSLLAAFPDRVARFRDHQSKQAIMVGRRGLSADKSRLGDALESGWFVVLDVDDAGRDALVRMAVPIETEWLDDGLKSKSVRYSFDMDRKVVTARRVSLYLDLEIEEVPVACHPGDEVAVILEKAVSSNWREVLPDSPAIDRLLWILDFEDGGHMTPQLLEDTGKEFIGRCTSFEQLRKQPWLDYLRGHIGYERVMQWDIAYPEKIPLPSGRETPIRYENGKAVIQAKIQELFTMASPPRLAGGKLPIQFHLCGPNGRTEQVTEDLESFWKLTYATVRKDLRGRYPKHHWPEDPIAATPRRGGLAKGRPIE
ncbi:MAG: ATP-dependent helicase C-terminal domain-containing protein [Planctomycetota bacterium]